MQRTILHALAIFTLCAAPAFAAPDQASIDDKDQPQEQTVVTTHSLTLHGETIHYTATAGTLILKRDAQGKQEPRASVFYVAYTRDDVTSTETRPLTFSFNGGPGSSSVWLHLGVLGPRRVELDDQGMPPRPPYRLIDNDYTLLDQSDLVFIDPVSTGYSRPVPGEDPGQFHGVQEDVQSVAEFIRLYVTRNQRWGSPKFLIGESYGTTRAAGLAGYLQESLGMNLNGIMLVSSILDFQTISFTPGNDLPYVLFLPSFTATAWYHHKLPDDLQSRKLTDVMAEVSQFAMNDYLLALMQGQALGAEVRRKLVARLARYTGLSAEYLEQANLRVSMGRFAKELLRSERRTLGRFDGRYTGFDRDAAGETPDADPSFSALLGPFTATLNNYLHTELNYRSDLPYEIITGRVHPWNYSAYENRYLNVAETLRDALSFNPALQVFVGSGYYDLATPFLATDYTFDHLGLEFPLQKNITRSYYEAGHMMYVHRPSLEKLRNDLGSFIRAATPDAVGRMEESSE